MQTTPYSNIKIFAHAQALSNLKEGRRTAPIYIRIKPTNNCNHNCSYCHYKNPYLSLDQYNGNDFIPRERMLTIIEDMAQMGVKAVTFSGGGEPLLYPYIDETMRRLLDYGIDLSVITNGSLLEGKTAELLSRAKWVRISLESGCEETYDKIRGIKNGSFEKLCNNIKDFSHKKNNECELGINFVVGPENYKEVYLAGKLMEELGADHIKYAAQISNDTAGTHAPFRQEAIDQIHRLAREAGNGFKVINLYETDFDTCTHFVRSYDKCRIKDFVCVIAANSKVYYCHDKAYLSDGEIGDLANQSFRELWFSEETTKKFSGFHASEQCMHHCVYDNRNILLNSYFDLDPNHINFI